MAGKTKLELTWIGKDIRPRLEPRILIEEPEFSHHAATRKDGDIFDNMLIHGDNLLALKALEADPAVRGKVKCVYVDPPFNTGSAFEHYNDGVEHSIWLGLMRERFEILRNLLRDDGLLCVHLDDGEMAYAKVLLDEVFQRSNYCNMIAMKTNDPSGFKATAATIFSTSNFILIYAKNKQSKPINKVFIPKGYDSGYNKFLVNARSAPTSEWSWTGIGEAFANSLGYGSTREAKRALGDEFENGIPDFAIQHADRVFQLVAIGGGAAKKRKATIDRSRENDGLVFIHPNEDIPEFYIANGRQMVFYEKRLLEVDGRKIPAEIMTDFWSDISWNGIANEGGVDFKNGKKPEALIHRVLAMTTDEGDLVLDSFAGSGTTGAVAHKMGRRWIMVELGDHAKTHVVPRLKKVINGTDKSGVTEISGWKSGGGFRFVRLAPSLLEKDTWGNWVITNTYNPAMLAEAMCKHFGFTYAPSTEHYWMHGASSETSYIYVTTASLTHVQLRALSDEVGDGRSLLICCTAFEGDHIGDLTNLTIRKIPGAVLDRCEWGKDDYSLKIESLPMMAEDDEDEGDGADAPGAKPKTRNTPVAVGDLFADEGE